MAILAYLIGSLLLGLLVLLALPVELSLQLEKEKTLEYGARLHWLFGLVSVDLSALAKKAGTPKKKKRKKTKPHAARLPGGKMSLRRVTRLIRGLRRSLQIKELSLDGRIGLGDPACTGMLMGVLQPLLLPARNMTLVADYQEAVFQGRFTARVRLVPIRVLGALAVFFFSRER
jgi:hypothetical protein